MIVHRTLAGHRTITSDMHAIALVPPWHVFDRDNAPRAAARYQGLDVGCGDPRQVPAHRYQGGHPPELAQNAPGPVEGNKNITVEGRPEDGDHTAAPDQAALEPEHMMGEFTPGEVSREAPLGIGESECKRPVHAPRPDLLKDSPRVCGR